MSHWIRNGLRSGVHHRGLVLAVYLASLVPAALWALLAYSTFTASLADRPFADGLLGPEAFRVWVEFAANHEADLGPLFDLVPILGMLTVLVQIMISAGAMNVLQGSGLEGSFFVGVRRFTGRFVRSFLAFGLTLVPVLMVFGMGSGLGSRLAESTGNGNLRLVFAAASFLVAFLLFVVFDLAYDLSRISAVAQDGRQTFRGHFRALASVLRRPGRLVGLYLTFVVLVVAVVLVYRLLRGSFAATTGSTILAAFILQQLSMLLRAFLQVGLLGGEVAAYRGLDAPDWCRGGSREPSGAPAPQPEPIPVSGAATPFGEAPGGVGVAADSWGEEDPDGQLSEEGSSEGAAPEEAGPPPPDDGQLG